MKDAPRELDKCESSSGVEHHLAKVRVAGSNPVFRSFNLSPARVVELVDTLDLKSNDHCGRAGSSPASSTRTLVNQLIIKGFSFYVSFFVRFMYDFTLLKYKNFPACLIT